MTPEQFVYWLQGYLEIVKPETITAEELAVIKEHMAKVLTYKPIAPIPNIGGTIPYRPLTPVTWGPGPTGPFDSGHTYC